MIGTWRYVIFYSVYTISLQLCAPYNLDSDVQSTYDVLAIVDVLRSRCFPFGRLFSKNKDNDWNAPAFEIGISICLL